MGKNRKTVQVDPAIEQRRSPMEYVLAMQKFRTRQDIASLRIAIESANNIVNFDRFLLHQVYRDIVSDPFVTSQWDSRKMKTKEKKFKVVSDAGEKDDKLSEVFEAGWFHEWIDAALDSRFWGFSLIEFGPLVEGKFRRYQVDNGTNKRIYDAITVVDRDNVKPEFGIITSSHGDATGVAFSDKEYKDYIMPVGQAHDLGILFKLAKYVLFKSNCLGNWSEWVEVFGMDKRVGYTKAQDVARTNFMMALRDLGNNSYGVFADTDKIEYIGSARTDAYGVYLEFLKYVDSNIAKVIFGQDVVTNNTGHVIGEVGENVANMYGDTDAKFIMNLVNDELIPMMENLGFSFGGKRFEWDNDEKLTMTERMAIDSAIVKDMGKTLDDKYVEDTYGVVLGELEELPEPKDLYP